MTTASPLTPQNLQPPSRTIALEIDNIQGDVLIGMQKNYERFVFFAIANVPAFKAALKSAVGDITTTADVQVREFQLRDLQQTDPKNIIPLVGLNIGFTNSGITKLVGDANLGDPSFAAGAIARAASLSDPTDANGTPTTWLPAYANGSIDGVFLITGGQQADVDGERDRIVGNFGAAITIADDQLGQVRQPPNRGHEHFGWLDGVSQPGIADLANPFPGQREIDPGSFVFGYGVTAAPALPWMKNGSFMVFRRLEQLVPEFKLFLETQAAALGMDPVLLGARIVGRWKSGAPLATTPMQDDAVVGGDPTANNNFDFSDDPAQRRCPFGAHIRKTNPRADFGLPAGTSQINDVDPHRIMRQGIPFGPEVQPAEAANNTTQEQRGLLFVCYQTSIQNQFEFVQTQWANNTGFIFDKTRPSDGLPVTVGVDPIIGQLAQGVVRNTDEPVPNYPSGNERSSLDEPQAFIVPTGGAYFFAPSIAALNNELST